MRYVSEHGEAIVKSALDHLNAKGIEFLHEHPFSSHEADFPKTFALVKDLATRVSTGEITMEDAHHEAVASMDAECQEHLTADNPIAALLAGLSQRLAN